MSSKVVLCGQKWFYVFKSGFMYLKVVYVVKSGFMWLRVVVCG